MGEAKRRRIAEQRRQKTQLKMSVVNTGTQSAGDPLELTQEVRQCHAALLYADEVKLISPRAALLNSALNFSQLQGIELVQACATLASTLHPESADGARLLSVVAGLPSSHFNRVGRGAEHRKLVQGLIDGLDPFIESFQSSLDNLLQKSGFDRLRRATEEGILTIVDIGGTETTQFGGSDGERRTVPMVEGLIARIQELLTAENEYPLFDTEGNNLVRLGVQEGILTPVPMARRLGADAAMAQGLFDCLQNFPHATTDEILDIRRTLHEPLARFRSGVRELTSDLLSPPESKEFGGEIEDAWNLKVAPALNEIDVSVQENSSLRDLAGRVVDEASGLASLTATAALGTSLAVAAGPTISIPAAAAFAVTTSVAAARAYRSQSRSLRETAETQFYFLYGANARMGAQV